MMDLRALMRDAERALIQRRSEDAYVILDEIVANGGIEAEVGSALFLKASGYEKGYGPRGVDYPRALDNYRRFISFAGDESISAVRGYIGAARVLAAIDEKQHAASIIECCENANRIRPTGAAANLIGYVMHEVLGDRRAGRHWFMRALRKRSIWGLVFIGNSLMQEKRCFMGLVTLFVSKTALKLLMLVGREQVPYEVD